MPLSAEPASLACLLAALALVGAGAAVQVCVGAGLSVVCGPFLTLWLGPAAGIPTLLALNLLVSVVACARDARGLAWDDAFPAAGATLAGCALASLAPGMSETALRLVTAGALAAVALPRPPAPESRPDPNRALLGISLAALATGALTAWTATPGPLTAAALARAGRPGSEIRRTMQPISVAGYGAALVWAGPSGTALALAGPIAPLALATLAGIAAGFAAGFALRPRVDAARVVLLVRATAGTAALTLAATALLGS